MTAQLLLVALLMMIASLVIIFWPRRASVQFNQSRTELFRERLQLLVLARDNGELAQADFAQAAAELKQHFVESAPVTPTLTSASTGRLLYLALLLLLLLVGTSYWLTGHYKSLNTWVLAQQSLPSYGERALLNKGAPLSDEEISLFALALRTKLAVEGDDAVAWFVLGRIWFSQGLVEESLEAFEKALLLTPERVNLRLSYAQALLVTESAENMQKAAQSLGLVLQKEPGNTDALSMLALIAQQRGDIKEARAAWELLLAQLQPADPRYPMIQQQLAALNGSAVATVPATTVPTTTGSDTSTGTGSDRAAKDPASSGRRIVIQLTINDSLAAKFADASLFVVAKAVAGSPMPLAVQKLPVLAGRQQIELTSAMVMQPGWGLDNVEQVVVSARISQSGAVSKTAGDPEIVSDVLTFSQGQPLTLTMELSGETTD
jgi:cytochrome c-type biogenesis protein CcmI